MVTAAAAAADGFEHSAAHFQKRRSKAVTSGRLNIGGGEGRLVALVPEMPFFLLLSLRP